MSLVSLPSELISRICGNMGETDPPNRALKLKERAKHLMALRLTSKRICDIASRHLIRYLIMAPKQPESWMKTWLISREWMAPHLRHLCLEMREGDADDPALAGILDSLAARNHQLKTIDLSLFENLKTIQCNVWHVVKVCPVKIPPNRCGFSYGRNNGQFNLWQDFPITLGNITQYGFEFHSLTLNLYYHLFWSVAVGLNDISKIRYLELDFDSRMTPVAIQTYDRLLCKIRYLPNLQKFTLNQNGHRHQRHHLPYIPNILRMLHNRYWPNLRHLDLRNLVMARFSDLVGFLAPHEKRRLTSLHITGRVLCTRMVLTGEDFRLEGCQTFRWIATSILPDPNQQGGQ